MRFPPPSVYETWPHANYVDPPTRGPELFIFTAIFLFLATVAVGIRLYTRIVIRRWFGVDDAFIILSYVWRPLSVARCQCAECKPRF